MATHQQQQQQAVPRPQPALERPAATLLQDRTTQAVVAASQCIVVLSQWGRTEGGLEQRLQPAAVLLLMLSALAVMCAWKPYWRHRSWLLPLARMLVILVPSTRAVGVGTVRAPPVGA